MTDEPNAQGENLDPFDAFPPESWIRKILERATEPPILPSDLSYEDLVDRLPEDAPREGTTPEEVLAELDEVVFRNMRRNSHPGFMGYVCSAGLPTDAFAHALTAALNQNLTSFSSAPGATAIERTLLQWLVRLAGLPPGSDGILLSGGSLANSTGITCALHDAYGSDLRHRGLPHCVERRGHPRIYIAETAHFTAERAATVLGLGMDSVRRIPVGDDLRILPTQLRQMIREDRAGGHVPICVVGSAGATTTGTVDPLAATANVCEEEEVWFHVDAAYGGGVLLHPELSARLDGISRASSITVDLHKWFFVAFDCSALLLRDPETAKRVFFARADYVQLPRDGSPEEFAFFHRSPETSRRFRALPAWIALRLYGADRLGRLVKENVDCCEHLAERVRAHPDLEVVTEPGLSIFCFRYAPAEARDPGEIVDGWNEAIRLRLLEKGDFYLSGTSLHGRPVLRVCILTPNTRRRDMDGLVEQVLEIGDELRHKNS